MYKRKRPGTFYGSDMVKRSLNEDIYSDIGEGLENLMAGMDEISSMINETYSILRQKNTMELENDYDLVKLKNSISNSTKSAKTLHSSVSKMYKII